jgi:membrane-bound lytic murein transglycosylase F
MHKTVLISASRKLVSLLIALLLGLLFSSCPGSRYRFSDTLGTKGGTLEKIRERQELIAITEYSPTTYFIFRGEPMGFHYEMLRRFSKHLGVRLQIRVSSDLQEVFRTLNEGEADLIAMDLTLTRDRMEMIDFVHPHGQTRQVLVQRKPGVLPDGSKQQVARFIRNPLDLAGKVVYVQKGSAFIDRLRNLEEEIGDTIRVIEHPNEAVEGLIRKVASGEIDYTVADENIALFNQYWHPELDVKTAISFPQQLAWAVRKGSDSLHNVLNLWMKEFVTTAEYKGLRQKYYRSPQLKVKAEQEFASDGRGVISRYDEDIRKHSRLIGWDWRIIASLIYQESRFHPEASGHAGSYGLMQLMPETARLMGIDSSSSPSAQIRAGVLYLGKVEKRLEALVPDKEERIRFTLASYNVGLAHVLDAQRLAKKHGKDPHRWYGNVEYYLLRKSLPDYYNDPVVRNGACRGDVPVKFVRDIEHRYRLYKDAIRE